MFYHGFDLFCSPKLTFHRRISILDFGNDIWICEESFTWAMITMDNGSKFKIIGLHYSTNSTFLVFSTAFSSNHEVIIPILTELCVHTVGNYIYGTDTPFPCENHQYVRRKPKYSKGRCLYYCNSCASRRLI